MPPKRVLNTPTRVGIIGTYIPRRCGIATFSADLLAAMKEEAPETEFWSLAMNDVPEGYDYPSEVQFEIGQKAIAEPVSASRAHSSSHRCTPWANTERSPSSL